MQKPFDPDHFSGVFANIAGDGNVRLHEPMKNHTSFRIGGPADLYVTPADAESVRRIIGVCQAEDLPYFVMGNGSNLLVRDGGIRGAVVNLSDKFNRFTISGNRLISEAGALVTKAANAAFEAGLGGMEFASGIPGTIGGAVMMNAGAYDGEMKDIVERTVYLDADGAIRTIEGADHDFGYRTSVFQKTGGIVLETTLRLTPGDISTIRSKTEDYRARRRDKQPLEYPSAGSVFKRPAGHFAGQMIEQCGLKGLQMGGARISEKHAGFIINTGGATAADVQRLIEYATEAVYNDFGIRLETEIRITGAEADR